MMTIAQIKRALNKSAMYITFIKKDGSERKMFCTTDWKTIEDMSDDFGYVAPKNPGSRPLPKHLLRVWDMENLDWRTVNLNTITSAEIDA